MPRVTGFIAEVRFGDGSGTGNGLCRMFLKDNGRPYFRYRNPSGWSAEYYLPLLGGSQDTALQEGIANMRSWIEKSSGKPLWQALRDSP